MAMFKCKMCGGDIHAESGATSGTCDSCQLTSTVPKANEERIINLFNRANYFRRLNEFDKALATYENILNEDSSNAEAHWGVVLCRYGIEYVEDPKTGKRVPTCHRTQHASILSDIDYMVAVDNAPDNYAKGLYEQEAKAISDIQKSILTIANREEPFDVFICYKESTDGGSRTVDSTLAQDIYYQLTNDGFKVFFSRITLENKLGQEYEPYIFNALHTAKVMLVIGTKKEYFDAVWVKNEWSRYLTLIKDDRSRLLIPCYRDINPYDMPDELAPLQSQDMSKIGFMQDLIHGVRKVLESSTTTTSFSPASGISPGIESLMKRGWLFLEDSDWKQANEYFDKVLDIDAEYAPAYIGKLCASIRIKNENALITQVRLFNENPDYIKALRFADSSYKTKLDDYHKTVLENNEKAKLNLAELREISLKYSVCISYSGDHIVALKSDGTALASGNNDVGQCIIYDERSWQNDWRIWHNYIAIVAASEGNQDIGYSDFSSVYGIDGHTVGLRSDGTAVGFGGSRGVNTPDVKKPPNTEKRNVSSWRSIVAIAACIDCTVGLKSDGTVVTTNGRWGASEYDVSSWCNIIAITAKDRCIVGLRTDGTVVATGRLSNFASLRNQEWRNIVAITTDGKDFTGLKDDGTVVTTNEKKHPIVSTWTDIIALGDNGSLGLKSDGTVVTADTGEYFSDYSNWNNIVALSSNGRFGIKSDGTIAILEKINEYIDVDIVAGWQDIGPVSNETIQQWKIEEEQEEQRRITEARIKEEEEQRKIAEEKRIQEEKRKHDEQVARWVHRGLCRYDGGDLRGILTKKCKICGRTQ